jgi:kynurenine formamidase
MSLLGRLLANRRAGEADMAWNLPALHGPESLTLTSRDFGDGDSLPLTNCAKFIGGHDVSPHLAWNPLAHWSTDGEVYPGRPRAQAVTPAGVTHGSTTAFAAGIVTRGVLLDLAVDGPLPSAYGVTSHDFEQAEKRQGVQVSSGDALVVRLGWTSTPVADRTPSPGISLDAVRWMDRRGVALCASDRGDAHPPLDPNGPSPLHGVALGRMAMTLIDAANLDDLAALCAQLQRYSFLLTIAPPRIHGLTGVPVNPIALF